MMYQEATVAHLKGDHAYVEVGGEGGCGLCHEAGGCQSGLLGQLFGAKPRQFRIANRIGAMPGDRVIVSVAEGAAWRAALLTYILPVFFLLLGAAAGTVLGKHDDVWTALGALAGFAIGVLAGLTFRQVRIGKIAEPVLLRSVPPFCPTKKACR